MKAEDDVEDRKCLIVVQRVTSAKGVRKKRRVKAKVVVAGTRCFDARRNYVHLGRREKGET